MKIVRTVGYCLIVVGLLMRVFLPRQNPAGAIIGVVGALAVGAVAVSAAGKLGH